MDALKWAKNSEEEKRKKRGKWRREIRRRRRKLDEEREEKGKALRKKTRENKREQKNKEEKMTKRQERKNSLNRWAKKKLKLREKKSSSKRNNDWMFSSSSNKNSVSLQMYMDDSIKFKLIFRIQTIVFSKVCLFASFFYKDFYPHTHSNGMRFEAESLKSKLRASIGPETKIVPLETPHTPEINPGSSPVVELLPARADPTQFRD